MATAEARRTIAGHPHAVYDLIADVTRMGEWSPESAGAAWLTEEPGAVGPTFRGDNRRPWVRWTTTSGLADTRRGRPAHIKRRCCRARVARRSTP